MQSEAAPRSRGQAEQVCRTVHLDTVRWGAEEKLEEAGEQVLIEIGKVPSGIRGAIVRDPLQEARGQCARLLATAAVHERLARSLKAPCEHLLDSVAHVGQRQAMDDEIARARVDEP